MLVGYARVLTTDQNLDFQNDALHAAGCEKIFTDVASGTKSGREGLDAAPPRQTDRTGLGGYTLSRAGFTPARRWAKFHGGIAASNSF